MGLFQVWNIFCLISSVRTDRYAHSTWVCCCLLGEGLSHYFHPSPSNPPRLWTVCSPVSRTAFSGDQGHQFGSLLEFWAFPASRRPQDRPKSGGLSSAISVLRNLKLDEDTTVSDSLFPVFGWDPEKSSFLSGHHLWQHTIINFSCCRRSRLIKSCVKGGRWFWWICIFSYSSSWLLTVKIWRKPF